MDGVTLSESLHSRGINIRYLGKITAMLSKMKQLEYLHTIAVAELITRAAKHIFNVYMQVNFFVKNANSFKNISTISFIRPSLILNIY